MQPKVFNNQPPQSSDPLPDGNAGAPGDVQFPEGMSESFVVKFCRNRNAAFNGWFGPFINKIKEAVKQARNLPTGKAKGAQQLVPLPISYGISETISARLTPIILLRPKFVEAVPEFVSMDNTSARKIEDFVNQCVAEETRKPDTGKAGIKSAIVQSFLVWRNVWKQTVLKDSVPQYVPDPLFVPDPLDPTSQPPMVYQGEQMTERMVSKWTWELKDAANIAWEPHTTTTLADSPWVREKSKMSYNELLRWQQEGRIQGVDRLRFVIPNGAQGSMREDWEAEIRQAKGEASWTFAYADERMYEIEEWWADLTFKQGETHVMGKYRWFIVEGQYVLSFEENPLIPQRHPYDSCPFLIDPHSITGTSPLDAVANIQEQINTFAGLQGDLANRAAKPMILYDESSGLSKRSNFMKMAGLQPVQNVQGIKEMVADATPINVIQGYINFLIQLAREASGINEQMQGIDGADTATEFQGLQAAAGIRIADIADTLSQGWLEHLGRECYLHYKQFGQDNQMVVRLATTEGAAEYLTRQDFQGGYIFVAASNATEQAKNAELTRITQVMEMASKMPPTPDGRVFNSEKAFREIVLPSLGQKNGADWFLAPAMNPMMAMPGAVAPMDAPGSEMPMEGDLA